MVAQQVQWCGGNTSVDSSATIIEKQLDAAQYFNHTGKAIPKETVPGY
jgi:hypothetical protein